MLNLNPRLRLLIRKCNRSTRSQQGRGSALLNGDTDTLQAKLSDIY